MEQFKANPATRLFLLGSALVILAGIALTGFRTVHWFLYVPVVFFTFAAATGICPGLILTNLLVRKRKRD